MTAAFHHAELTPQQRGLDGIAIERAILTGASCGAGWLTLACGVVLLVRRLAGGVTSRPGSAALVLVCIVGGLLVVASDVAAKAASTPRRLTPRIGLMMAVIAMAIPFPDGHRGAAAMAVASLAFAGGMLAEPWISRLGWRQRDTGEFPTARRLDGPIDAAPSMPSATMPAVPWPAAEAVPDRALAGEAGRLVQHLERFVRVDGMECVRGRLFLAVPAGVRTASGHVGFCPPFATTPTVDVSTAYDEVEAVVAAADVLPWGIRVECRLDEPADEAFEIPIDLFASSQTSSRTLPQTT